MGMTAKARRPFSRCSPYAESSTIYPIESIIPHMRDAMRFRLTIVSSISTSLNLVLFRLFLFLPFILLLEKILYAGGPSRIDSRLLFSNLTISFLSLRSILVGIDTFGQRCVRPAARDIKKRRR